MNKMKMALLIIFVFGLVASGKIEIKYISTIGNSGGIPGPKVNPENGSYYGGKSEDQKVLIDFISDLFVDEEGYIYATSGIGYWVQKFSPEGKVVMGESIWPGWGKRCVTCDEKFLYIGCDKGRAAKTDKVYRFFLRDFKKDENFDLTVDPSAKSSVSQIRIVKIKNRKYIYTISNDNVVRRFRLNDLKHIPFESKLLARGPSNFLPPYFYTFDGSTLYEYDLKTGKLIKKYSGIKIRGVKGIFVSTIDKTKYLYAASWKDCKVYRVNLKNLEVKVACGTGKTGFSDKHFQTSKLWVSAKTKPESIYLLKHLNGSAYVRILRFKYKEGGGQFADLSIRGDFSLDSAGIAISDGRMFVDAGRWEGDGVLIFDIHNGLPVKFLDMPRDHWRKIMATDEDERVYLTCRPEGSSFEKIARRIGHTWEIVLDCCDFISDIKVAKDYIYLALRSGDVIGYKREDKVPLFFVEVFLRGLKGASGIEFDDGYFYLTFFRNKEVRKYSRDGKLIVKKKFKHKPAKPAIYKGYLFIPFDSRELLVFDKDLNVVAKFDIKEVTVHEFSKPIFYRDFMFIKGVSSVGKYEVKFKD